MNIADQTEEAANVPLENALTAQNLRSRIDAIVNEPLGNLQTKWRKLFRNSAPPHLPRYLLVRILSYKIQADELGDLDPASIRYLKRIAQDRAHRLADPDHRKGKAPPPIPPVTNGSSLKPGTILVREHDGELYHVVVRKAGFFWNETTYRSLSEVAQAITGTKWSGPRFFGLRSKGSAKISAKQEGAAR